MATQTAASTNPQPLPPGRLNLRTLGLVLGVLLIQLAFIGSYVGAFHAPEPHRIPVAVVAPAAVQQNVVTQLENINSEPLAPAAATDQATAVAQLRAGDVSGVFVINPSGTQDTLFVANGAGASIATALQSILTEVNATQGRTLTINDAVPLQSGDARGLSGFYIVTGWIVGGYLLAALLGMTQGARPQGVRALASRLAIFVPYAIASGIGGMLILDPLLGAVTGHFWSLSALGALIVFTAATVTLGLQVLAGVLGIGLTVLLFVVIGNPTAGGAYQANLLPPLWRVFTESLPNGAGVDALRRIVYLGGNGIGQHLAVISAWAVVALAVSFALTRTAERRTAARAS